MVLLRSSHMQTASPLYRTSGHQYRTSLLLSILLFGWQVLETLKISSIQKNYVLLVFENQYKQTKSNLNLLNTHLLAVSSDYSVCLLVEKKFHKIQQALITRITP